MKQNKFQAICFDMWGTLVEGGGGKEWTDLQQILRANSIDEKTFQTIGIKSLLSHPWLLRQGIRNLAKKLVLKINTETVEKAYKSWWSLVEKSKLYPETIPVLKKLKARRTRLIIISNTDSESFYFKIKKTGLDKYFERFFISGQIGKLKHEGRMFQLAQNYLSLPKDQILMVDDSLNHGVKPARQFGWTALWVARGKEGEEGFKINDLRGIFDFL